MNTNVAQLREETLKAPTKWVVVTQVKSYRVIYFTDDSSYQPSMNCDWYYYGVYLGDLPAAMTLRNCWGWRFNGTDFVDAREVQAPPPEETLIESNRKALMNILNEKTNTTRQPYAPSCLGGEKIRELKFREAETYLASTDSGQRDTYEIATPYGHLKSVAVSRNISLYEAAQLIVAKAKETQRVLLETERFREQLSIMIKNAKTQEQLMHARAYLLDQIYPELSKEFKYPIQNTEPIDLDQPISRTQKVHEVARLKAQLREIINRRRTVLQSRYIQNDEIRKHKAHLARAVLSGDQEKLDKLEMEPLRVYAQARGLDLKEAAQLIVEAMTAAANLLVKTESLKDQFVPRIEAIHTLRHIQEISNELNGLDKSQ